VPIDPQRPAQRLQGWLILAGFAGTVIVIVILSIWASHQG
jgi:hypothetical protein